MLRLFPCVLLVLAIAAGCDKSNVEGKEISSKLKGTPQPKAKRIYDAKGDLIPSTSKVFGVTLPNGLTKSGESKDKAIFHAQIKAEKLTQFFTGQLAATKIRRWPAGAQFEAAVPKGDDPSKGRVNLSIFATSTRTRVEIERLAPLPKILPTPDEIEKAAEKERLE